MRRSFRLWRRFGRRSIRDNKLALGRRRKGKKRTDAEEVAVLMAAAARLLAAMAELAAPLAALPVPVIKAQYPPDSCAQTVTLQT